MRMILGFALLALLLAANANATPFIDDHSINNEAEAKATSAATANGGAGGSAVNTNVNAPVTTNTNTARIERGAVDVDVDISNKNNNRNSNTTNVSTSTSTTTSQHQRQSQSSVSDVSDSGNSSITWNERRQTAGASAPAVFAAAETCVQSQSAGAQGPAFGISLGFSHDNEGCNMRRNAGMLFALGRVGAAIELMCSDDDVRDAMRSAGTPCAADTGVSEMPVAPNKTTTELEEKTQKTAEVETFRPMVPIRD